MSIEKRSSIVEKTTNLRVPFYYPYVVKIRGCRSVMHEKEHWFSATNQSLIFHRVHLIEGLSLRMLKCSCSSLCNLSKHLICKVSKIQRLRAMKKNHPLYIGTRLKLAHRFLFSVHADLITLLTSWNCNF